MHPFRKPIIEVYVRKRNFKRRRCAGSCGEYGIVVKSGPAVYWYKRKVEGRRKHEVCERTPDVLDEIENKVRFGLDRPMKLPGHPGAVDASEVMVGFDEE